MICTVNIRLNSGVHINPISNTVTFMRVCMPRQFLSSLFFLAPVFGFPSIQCNLDTRGPSSDQNTLNLPKSMHFRAQNSMYSVYSMYTGMTHYDNRILIFSRQRTGLLRTITGKTTGKRLYQYPQDLFRFSKHVIIYCL